jgi:hypothetical protein
MSVMLVKETVFKFVEDTFGQKPTIVAINQWGEYWYAEVEVIVHDEYMRKRAQKAIIETYKIALDNTFKVVSFERIRMRVKGSIEDTSCADI